MQKTTIALIAMALAGLSGSALAKLPAPSEEAKTAAALAKEKAAWGDKVAAYQLCKSQDKVAAQYLKGKKDVKPAETPACADPGPFVASTPAPAPPAAAPAAAPAAPQAAAQPAAQAQVSAKK